MNKVAKSEIEEVIVCGRSTIWWDSEIKEMSLRRALYRKVISDLWAEYCQLHREVKD